MGSITEVKPQEEYLFDIPKDQETAIRIVSDYEYLGRHWDGHTYIPCVGKEAGCPFCAEDEKPVGRYICYIADNAGDILLAGLPYRIFQRIKEMYDEAPTEFGTNSQGHIIPNFFVNVFKSGSGMATRYNVEKGLPVATPIDISARQAVTEYVKLQKEGILKALTPPTAQAGAEAVENNNEVPPAPVATPPINDAPPAPAPVPTEMPF